MRPKVYISGPITKGNRTSNFAQACHAQKTLMAAGFAVLNPMLSMMHPDAWNIDHETWVANDLPWVACADVVLRLPGESDGAERECEFARHNNIAVIHTVPGVIRWVKEIWQPPAPIPC